MLMSKKSLLKTIVVAVLMAVGGNAFAQSASADKGNSFYLNFGGEVGGANCSDRSVVPFTISGIAKGIDIGFTDEWKRCHIQYDFDWKNTSLINPSGVSNYFSTKLEFLYSCLKPTSGRWHFWSGASVGGVVDYKNIPDLENAQTTLSIFGTFSAEELVQCNFAYDKNDKSHPWMTASLRFSLPLFTVASRPGYAYVRDPLNSATTLDYMFAPNEIMFKMFPGYSYDLGLTVNLRNGNRISFGHRVDFLSTGKKGVYRYDNAFRTAYIQFMFKI